MATPKGRMTQHTNPSPESAAPSARRRPRIWVADDVPMEAADTAKALSAGFEVQVFHDGSGVIERAATGELPDLVVLDWHMPTMTGLEVCDFFRTNPRTAALPILVLTSTGDEQDLLQALASGADDYVTKGASHAELNARVRALLRSRALLVRAESAETALAAILVREREARAEAESANQAKDVFLATVSHELRTPLNAIMGWATLLQRGLDPEGSSKAVDTIVRNARVQARIIDDLLDISRIATGKVRLELAPLDAAREVASVVEANAPAAKAKDVTLTSELEPGVVIAGDSSRVQQIVSNLVSNAIKFSTAGGNVSVTLRRLGTEVLLRVQDDGIGIAGEFLPHIFDAFRQGDASSTRRHGGLGLGLAIVRELCELHGARVRADSAGTNQGSTFEVSFPGLDASSRPDEPTIPSDYPSGLSGTCVLVVDDDADGLDYVARVLSQVGAEVRTARSVSAALDLVSSWRPHVVVSDISMPARDGYDLSRTLNQPGASTPLATIALSAHARAEDRDASLRAGFREHLAKPVNPDDLLRAVKRHAPRRRAGAAR